MTADTLKPLPAPAAETKAFNDALEALLLAAPPVGSVPIEDIRRLRAEGKSVLPVSGPLPEAEWLALDSAGLGAEGGRDRIRLVAHAAPKAVMLHIHGGGWSIGSAESYDGRNLRLSRDAGVSVLSVHYRLGPEHKWPACADDCLAAARFAVGYAAERGLPLFIGGESAGAHLSAVTLLRLRDELDLGGAIRGAVLNYGCFDLRMTPSLANWGERNLILSTPIVQWFIDNLLSDPAQASDPLVSPLLADLSGMPPALIQCGDCDPLLDDSAFLATRWRAAGAAVELQLYPGGVHAFDMFDGKLAIADEALDAAAEWVKARV